MSKTKKRQAKKERNLLASSIKTRSQVTQNYTENQNLSINSDNMSQGKLENIIQHIPCFDGQKETNINFFIDQWEKLEEDSTLSDDIKLILLKSKFSGIARKVIINSKDLNEETDYANFKDKVKAEFKAKTNFEEIQSDFMSIKQKPNQTMEEFIKEFNLLGTTYIEQSGHAKEEGAVKFLQKLKLTRFLEAIRKDIAFEIRKTGPKDYKTASEMALTLERAFNSIPSEEINYANSASNSNDTNMSQFYQNKISKLEEEIQKLKLREKEETQSKIVKQCQICFKNNHETKHCFFNSKTNNYARKSNKAVFRPQNNMRYNTPQETKFQNFPQYSPEMQYSQNTQNYMPVNHDTQNCMGTSYGNMGGIRYQNPLQTFNGPHLIPNTQRNFTYQNVADNYETGIPNMRYSELPLQNPQGYTNTNQQNTRGKFKQNSHIKYGKNNKFPHKNQGNFQ